VQRKIRKRRISCMLALFFLFGAGLVFGQSGDENPPAAPPSPVPKSADCLDCHAPGNFDWSDQAERQANVSPVSADWRAERPRSDARRAGLAMEIDESRLKKSVHGLQDLSCLDCHAGVKELPHPAKLQPVNCLECHADCQKAGHQLVHTTAANRGDRNAPTCADCHGAHYIPLKDDPENPTARGRVVQLCGSCHALGKLPNHRRVGPLEEWQKSIHGQKKDGTAFNADCVACHTQHPETYETGSTAKARISVTCGQCHAETQQAFEKGVHGTAIAEGNLSSPTCTDCHGSHQIRAVDDPEAQVYGAKSVHNVCAQCHQAERINSRFAIQSTTKSFADSFHGLALEKGDLRSAGCASCHGAHDILPSSDPASRVHRDNLQETCGTCHPGIGRGVVQGKIHPSLSQNAETIGEKAQWWVKYLYIMLIPSVLGFMLLHNALDWLKKIRIHLRRQRAMGRYVRLSLNERIQHIVLMVSFTLLVISGFALTFGLKIPGISGELNEDIRAYTHRFAAVMMIGWAVYHTYWVVFTRRGRGYFWAMMPRLKDAYDIVYLIAYNLGLWKQKPKFERFSYIEKMEYLAMVWGTVVMVATGLLLWFQSTALRFLPLWGLDVANIIHYMEAILATLAIIIWHFYSVLFNPDVSPMATHWLTGTLTEEEMEHEHALELEKIKKAELLERVKESGQDKKNVE